MTSSRLAGASVYLQWSHMASACVSLHFTVVINKHWYNKKDIKLCFQQCQLSPVTYLMLALLHVSPLCVSLNTNKNSISKTTVLLISFIFFIWIFCFCFPTQPVLTLKAERICISLHSPCNYMNIHCTRIMIEYILVKKAFFCCI